MFNKKLRDAFNEQLNAELYSAYLYVSMAAYFESISLQGMANWMQIQAQEEMQHAAKFFTFINERGGRVLLSQIQGPETEWDSPLAVFQNVCTHESHVTSLINELVDLVIREKDHAANAFLQWFVTEQVEEEASAKEVTDKLKLAGDNASVLFLIDQELGQRTLSPTSTDQV